MQELRKKKDDNYYIENKNITLEEWLKEWMRVYKKPYISPRTYQGYVEKSKMILVRNLKLPSMRRIKYNDKRRTTYKFIFEGFMKKYRMGTV